MKKINVYGLGYIGLPTASLLATKGYNVLGIDTSREVVDTINKGNIHIVEPDLDILVKSAVNSGKLRAVAKPEYADVHIIAVPTPFKEHHEPDITYVEAAAEAIAEVLKEGNLVILESTSPVGTSEKLRDIFKGLCPDLDNIYVAYSPERVIPGQILRELVENDRVIGGVDFISKEMAVDFYKTFVKGTVFGTDSRTAEMCKLAENSFRDVNIAFANELSIICDELKINVWELIKLANHHPRVQILKPGPGVGGHCIAVDPWFIVNSSPKNSKIIKQAREVNNFKIEFVLNKAIEAAKNFTKPNIICLGATFKENIDDLRESPSLKIIHELILKNIGNIEVVEPNVECISEVKTISLDEGLHKADIIIILVGHKDFKKLNKEMLKNKVVIDSVGLLEN